jgi:hypothetical protein
MLNSFAGFPGMQSLPGYININPGRKLSGLLQIVIPEVF